ncbi:MAG: hypothetical protein KDC24_06535 [Saprospiraceae bacterium]|nr:hypothetical protein [Saprospiraceae bacterium]
MRTNNFKRLMEEEEAKYELPPPKITRNVEQTTGVFSFAANIIEVFLPKVLDVFVAMSVGEDKNEKNPPSGRFTPDQGFKHGPGGKANKP